MSDQRPAEDKDRAGALSRDMPCGSCGHISHPIEGCEHCPCQWHV